MRATTVRRQGGLRVRFVIGWVITILFGLGLIGYVAIPSFGNLVNGGLRSVADGIRGFINPTLEIVRPGSAASDDELADHPADLAIDGITNTEWQAAGDAPILVVTFEDPVDLGALNIYNGAKDPNSPALRLDLRRATRLELVSQSGASTTLELRDVRDLQTLTIDLPDVERLEIRVSDTAGPGDAPVALSELEFFRKS